ncbi:uncharacterized protein DS421_16g545800 [Arachis hypogaea]|nr:uncharacterized protein DS421_16g545800 [Arachis hypogaea]
MVPEPNEKRETEERREEGGCPPAPLGLATAAEIGTEAREEESDGRACARGGRKASRGATPPSPEKNPTGEKVGKPAATPPELPLPSEATTVQPAGAVVVARRERLLKKLLWPPEPHWSFWPFLPLETLLPSPENFVVDSPELQAATGAVAGSVRNCNCLIVLIRCLCCRKNVWGCALKLPLSLGRGKRISERRLDYSFNMLR